MNKSELGKLERYVQKAMEMKDDKMKLTILLNLQQKIVENIGNVISACSNLINENTELRLGAYHQWFRHDAVTWESMYLLEYHFNEVLMYENDSADMKAVRERRWQQWKNDPMEKPTAKEKDSSGCVLVWNAPDPNNTYREKGNYTRWRELRDKFKYRLCRKIRGCCGGGLETLFKAVCLYIALKNETAEDAEFLSLSEAETPTKEPLHEIEPKERYPQGLLSIYFNGDNELLQSFVNECKNGKFKARQVGQAYKQLGKKVLQRTNESFCIKELHRYLKDIGLIGIGYGTFKDYV